MFAAAATYFVSRRCCFSKSFRYMTELSRQCCLHFMRFSVWQFYWNHIASRASSDYILMWDWWVSKFHSPEMKTIMQIFGLCFVAEKGEEKDICVNESPKKKQEMVLTELSNREPSFFSWGFHIHIYTHIRVCMYENSEFRIILYTLFSLLHFDFLHVKRTQ